MIKLKFQEQRNNWGKLEKAPYFNFADFSIRKSLDPEQNLITSCTQRLLNHTFCHLFPLGFAVRQNLPGSTTPFFGVCTSKVIYPNYSKHWPRLLVLVLIYTRFKIETLKKQGQWKSLFSLQNVSSKGSKSEKL